MIKVLFLYKDRNYHYPILSTQMEIYKLGILLESVQIKSKEEAEQRVKAVENSYDLIIIHPEFFFDELENLKISVALSSQLDGGLVSPHVQLIKKVQGTIESYAYLPRSIHDLRYYRYSLKLLEEVGFKNSGKFTNLCHKEPNLSKEDLEKIHVYCGFGSWERMIEILGEGKIDFDRTRSTPIHFAGTTRYCRIPTQFHREKAVRVCREVGGIGEFTRFVKRPEYHQQLLNSKAVLSPWGWGECCHRDWEALAKGCVLIKPDCSFVESFPDLTSHQAPYIPCKLDFSDIPEIVDSLETHWESYRPLRERGLELAKKALDKKSNAKRLKEIIECILTKSK